MHTYHSFLCRSCRSTTTRPTPHRSNATRSALVVKIMREAVKADLHVEVSRGKGGLGQDLELLYFKLPRSNASRPDFAEAGLELKCSPVRRLKDGRLVPKERVSLSMIDYAHILDEEWETSAFLKKNRHLLLVFYLFDEHITSALDYTIKYVGRWSIPDECMPLLRDDWLYIQKMLRIYGPGGLSGRLTNHLEAAKKGALGINANRAFALKPAFVGKYVLPVLRTQPNILPQHLDAALLTAPAAKIRQLFVPFMGLTAAEDRPELGIEVQSGCEELPRRRNKGRPGCRPRQRHRRRHGSVSQAGFWQACAARAHLFSVLRLLRPSETGVGGLRSSDSC